MEREVIYKITEWFGAISALLIILAYCYFMDKLDDDAKDPKGRQSSKKLKVKRS